MPTLEYGGRKFAVDAMPTEAEFAGIAQHIDQLNQQDQQQRAAVQQKADAVSYGGEDPSVVTQLLGGAKHAWDSAAYGLQQTAQSALKLHPDWQGGDESLKPLYDQGKAFVAETGPASSIGEFTGNALMYAAPQLRAAKAGMGLLGQTATAGGVGYALEPEDKVSTAAFNAALGGAPLAIGKALTAVPTAASGAPISTLYRAGRTGEEGYRSVMRGLQTADEAVEFGASPSMAKAAAKAKDWTPDISHLGGNAAVNYMLGFGPVGTAVQALAASPRIGGELAFAAGSMARRLTDNVSMSVGPSLYKGTMTDKLRTFNSVQPTTRRLTTQE